MAPLGIPLLPGEPKESPKPQPIGNELVIFLITTCTLCGLFLLYRRSEMLRKVVSHRLKTFRRSEGHIRLSEEDGPSTVEFLAEDFDEDNEHLDMDSSTQAWREPNPHRILAISEQELTTLPPRSSEDTPSSLQHPPAASS
ncbi:hypothetical protein FA15DRAFT_632608 [Coprinopsis marcescibilis]|uniref:Uncharacterized protein n=1 Tax=Coprinopsis marcescibilis TaxID=230819 RepID=A0A5C3L9F7_COPMA|nr:hypothetical protein FA15DRAFT_632608 [Coprinopsis marcescibilis]